MTPVTWSIEIGQQLKTMREAAGLKQGELAAKLEKSPSYVGELERATHPPSEACFALMLDVFKLTEEAFYAGAVSTERLVELKAERVVKVTERRRAARKDNWARCPACGDDGEEFRGLGDERKVVCARADCGFDCTALFPPATIAMLCDPVKKS